MNDLEFIKKLLIQYKEALKCNYPNSMFSDKNYEELDGKDKALLQLIEYIIDYLEEEKAKQNGWYD